MYTDTIGECIVSLVVSNYYEAFKNNYGTYKNTFLGKNIVNNNAKALGDMLNTCSRSKPSNFLVKFRWIRYFASKKYYIHFFVNGLCV